MRGLDTVIALRRKRQKPSLVIVDLVVQYTQIAPGLLMPSIGIGEVVTVEILPVDRIGDIDFRPLLGLNVHLQDMTDVPERLRAAGKAIAAAKPKRLVMAFGTGMHVLDAGNPPTTETHLYA